MDQQIKRSGRSRGVPVTGTDDARVVRWQERRAEATQFLHTRQEEINSDSYSNILYPLAVSTRLACHLLGESCFVQSALVHASKASALLAPTSAVCESFITQHIRYDMLLMLS